ncbi:ubiquinol-cytochrome c reductase complex assembly factor 6 isoform X1 [Bos taurus]|uniref:ubiquinol-cytochrome c reductase complex assembly factor 6 isoform X1 n=1 Tax=Bos taurus TaxID=9913 RepID=UPI0003840884|nr:protein BRAWNIN isoform X1 [Bos taurus]XP_059742058.1 protein BRAWNIN isoform X1 [Bos taurus]XP_059742059.1 protein BRAWNIN isoform X1 [Bos taurus]
MRNRRECFLTSFAPEWPHLSTHGSVCDSPPAGESSPKMPAGVSWSSYLKMFAASLLAMCAGAEVVHRYYRPDLRIPEIPPKPGELKTELLGLKERQQEHQNSTVPRTL